MQMNVFRGDQTFGARPLTELNYVKIKKSKPDDYNLGKIAGKKKSNNHHYMDQRW